MPLTTIAALIGCTDAEERLHLLVRDARSGLAVRSPPDNSALIAHEEVSRVRAALETLSDGERVVVVEVYGIDMLRAAPLRTIEQAHGWTPGRASETRRRAIQKLHEAVYVPPLPPCGLWVEVSTRASDHWGTVAGVRVLKHKGRHQFIGAVMVLFNKDKPYWRVIEEGKEYFSVSDYRVLSLETALNFALHIDSSSAQLRAGVLISLAAHLPAETAWQACNTALAGIGALHQNDAAPLLAQILLLPQVSADLRSRVLDMLLPLIPKMGDMWAQSGVVYKIIPLLSDVEYQTFLHVVNEAFSDSWGTRRRDELLSMIEQVEARTRQV